MLGAIIGDIVGSPYEIINVYKRRDVEPFKTTLHGKCRFTDDSALTLAVARALISNIGETDMAILEQKVAEQLQEYYYRYPLKRYAGIGSSYGKGFRKWVHEDIEKSREAKTNGATMRVAPVGWLYSTMQETLRVAEATVVRTHNSKESIASAQAVAAVIFLARHTKDKEFIKKFVEEKFGYKLITTKKEIEDIRKRSKQHRNKNRLNGNMIDCDAYRSAVHAITAFLKGESFEDCIRLAISLGGDSDTIASMAGAMAEAYYGVPVEWKHRAMTILKKEGCYEEDITLISDFRKKYVAKLNENWKDELDM